MTPELKKQIDTTISHEHYVNLVELNHMAVDQLSGLPGDKRQHRYLSRWRNESAIFLTNFVIDNYSYMPSVTVTFSTSAPPPSYLEGINSIIDEYEALRMEYVIISRMALDEKMDELSQLAQKKLCWIAKTKMKYMRDLYESAGKTKDYLQLRSAAKHEKFKEKEKEFKIEEY